MITQHVRHLTRHAICNKAYRAWMPSVSEDILKKVMADYLSGIVPTFKAGIKKYSK